MASFPSSPGPQQIAIVNNISYIYEDTVNAWTRVGPATANVITTDTANIVATTSSTSTTTGALKVAGGAGIAGNVWAGNVYSTNYFYANGAAFTGGAGAVGYTGSIGTGYTGSAGAFTITTGSSKPATASIGDMWYNTTRSALFIRANVGVGTYWIDTTGPMYTFGQSAATTTEATTWLAATGARFTISPAVSGKTTWNTAIDGPLSISASNTYTLTPTYAFTASIKMWGAGGGQGTQDSSKAGAGGFSSGTMTFTAGQAYVLLVGGGGKTGGGGTALGGGGGGSESLRGGGGGYSGIFISSISQANARLMAGGGGGSGGNGGGLSVSGAGGGLAGQAGGTGIAGGTQISGTSGGTALQGASDRSGGGGGYFGGGAGGDSGYYVPGAGGGSGYINSTYVSSGVTTAGNYTTVANSSDADRGNSGNVSSSAGQGQDGRVYITAI